MCGIFGILSHSSREDFSGAVEKANKHHSCRGPDDNGFESLAGVFFGHTRLSILDLSSAGHQPMRYKDTVITYNGEIYNFRELREELKGRGYEFRTETDTEVILAGYDAWGIEVIKRLRGMFAFGLWDGKRKKLFLVKDRYGIKPLYYYKDKEKVIFSSTVKGLLKSGLVPEKRENKAWIGFLLFGSVPIPWTTVQDVFGVPAGHYLEIDESGGKIIKYYDPLDYFGKNNEVVVSKTRELLENSVRSHLVSDAPLGVFLSGGLDSSAIAALASRRISTLSIIFDEKEFSEERYSDIVAERIGSDHGKIKITKEDFLENLDDAFEAMDQPTIDGINTYFIAKAAKEAGLKTVLSGLGGDEIFMGYPSFRKAAMLRRIQALPELLKLPLVLGKILGGRWAKLSYLIKKNPIYFYLAIRGVFVPSEVAGILKIKKSEVEDFIDDLAISHKLKAKSLAELHPADLLSYLELKFYLQNQLLKDSDFMAMHHSLEVRVPFLDHELVEYISSIPAEAKLNFRDLKFKDSCPKPLLVAATHNDLPKEVWDRNKMGFTFPFQRWLGVKSHWSREWGRVILKKLRKT